jgi:phospholipid/cholesterol/gamma-HCH transport system ATP-binding protein
MGEGSSRALINNNDPWGQQFIKGLPDGPIHFHYPNIPFEKELNI